MNRVLIVAPYFPPATDVGVFRTLRFVKYMADGDWSAVVLTPTIAGSPAGDALLAQLPDDVVVRRVSRWSLPQRGVFSAQPQAQSPSGDATGGGSPTTGEQVRNSRQWPGKGLLRNTWQLVSQTPDPNAWWIPPAVAQGQKLIREFAPRVIYTSGPPHSVHLVGRALKRRTGVPWVADFRDPWGRRPWGRKENNPWGQRLAGFFESMCVAAADRVVLNTEAAVNDFRRHYPRWAEEKFLVIPNGCDPDLAPLADRLMAQVRGRAAGSIPCICHPGSLYRRRDPRPLVDAIAHLAQRGTRVRLQQIGSCDARFDLAGYAAMRGVADLVSLEERLPHEAVLQRMAESEINLLLQPDAPLMVPGKLFEMMFFDRPILAATEAGPTADLVREFRLGEVAPSRDGQALAAAIATILSNGPRGYPAEGFALARKVFDGRVLTRQLTGTFDEIMYQGPARNDNCPKTNVVSGAGV